MDDIIKKLLDGWVSNDIVEKLKAGLGNTFETELVNNGLRAAAEKIGIDPEHLPNIDLKNIKQAAQELIGKDIDKDGKVGITEAVETVSKSKNHLFAKIARFFLGKK
jgi:hypothetical protein